MNPHLEELACLYVLDQLDVSERAVFETRLLHNPELKAFVVELETALAASIRSLPQQEPPADLLARIEKRIDRLPTKETVNARRSVTPLWTSIARWGIAAVITISISTIAIQSLWRGSANTERQVVIVVGLDSRRSTLTELPMQKGPQNADARFIQLASLAEKYWEKPEGLPVKLRSTDQSGHGYALFDPGSNQGFIAIQHLPAIEQGKRYQLWVLDTASGQTHEAGILPLSSSNRGLYFFSIASDTEVKPDGMDFFVTEEDDTATQATQPHGKVVLGDKRI